MRPSIRQSLAYLVIVLSLAVQACTSTESADPGSPSPPGFESVKLPGFIVPKPDGWYLKVWPNHKGFQLSTLTPGADGNPGCGPDEYGGNTLDVEEGFLDYAGAKQDWPAQLVRDTDTFFCSQRGLERYLANFTVGGTDYVAVARVGRGPDLLANRALVFRMFSSIEFPDDSYRPWPTPGGGKEGFLFVAGGDQGPRGPWSLTMNGAMRYSTDSGTSQFMPAKKWMKHDKGFGGAEYVAGGPIFGVVEEGVSSIRFEPDSGGPPVEGTIFQAPHNMGEVIFIAVGPAFIVDVPRDAGPGRVIASDASGRELGRVRISPES